MLSPFPFLMRGCCFLFLHHHRILILLTFWPLLKNVDCEQCTDYRLVKLREKEQLFLFIRFCLYCSYRFNGSMGHLLISLLYHLIRSQIDWRSSTPEITRPRTWFSVEHIRTRDRVAIFNMFSSLLPVKAGFNNLSML